MYVLFILFDFVYLQFTIQSQQWEENYVNCKKGCICFSLIMLKVKAKVEVKVEVKVKVKISLCSRTCYDSTVYAISNLNVQLHVL